MTGSSDDFDFSVGMPGDWGDAAKMEPAQNPIGAAAGQAWWESLITYGVTRVIDNKYGPQNVAGNAQPGSFQGANGGTYQNRPTAPAVGGGFLTQPVAGIPAWVLLAGAAVALVIATR